MRVCPVSVTPIPRTVRWPPPRPPCLETLAIFVPAATAELLRRYLTAHGPATAGGFAWWTNLPLREWRAAVAPLIEQGGILEVWGHDRVGGELLRRQGLQDEVAVAGRQAGDCHGDLRPLPCRASSTLCSSPRPSVAACQRYWAGSKGRLQRGMPGNVGVSVWGDQREQFLHFKEAFGQAGVGGEHRFVVC